MRTTTARRASATTAALVTLLAIFGPLPSPAAADEPATWQPEEGRALIGEPAPAWRGLRWLQGGPLTVEELRGKAVLLRFWLVGCPYCRRSAPALVGLHERYRDRGLVVVGIHHPKSEAARDPEVVRRAAERYSFDFPVAMDDDWATIRGYGVGTHFQRFTSVSFLIDPEGTIRWVHDGGAYHPGDGEEGRAYESLVAAVEEWLPEGGEGDEADDRDLPARKDERVELTGTYPDIVHGERVDVAAIDQDVYLYFWSTYCAPCIEKIPELNSFNAKVERRERLRFLSVLTDAVFGAGMSEEEARRFVRERGVEYPVLYDQPGESLTAQLGVRAVPWSFLLDGSGKVIADKMTAGSDSTVMKVVRERAGLQEESTADEED